MMKSILNAIMYYVDWFNDLLIALYDNTCCHYICHKNDQYTIKYIIKLQGKMILNTII